MPGALRSSLLVHTATPQVTTAGPDAETQWIEGTPSTEGTKPRAGVPFPCVLFLPQAPEQAGEQVSWKPRVLTRPTLLYNPTRDDGTPVRLTKDAELDVLAVDLAPFLGAETVRWQLDGDPQPAGPPGRPVVVIANLKRVED